MITPKELEALSKQYAIENYPAHLRGDIMEAFEAGFYACVNYEKPKMQIKVEYDTTEEKSGLK